MASLRPSEAQTWVGSSHPRSAHCPWTGSTIRPGSINAGVLWKAEAPTPTPSCLWFKAVDLPQPARSWDLETRALGMWVPAERLPQAELWAFPAPLPAGPLGPACAPPLWDFAQTEGKLSTSTNFLTLLNYFFSSGGWTVPGVASVLRLPRRVPGPAATPSLRDLGLPESVRISWV